MDRRQFASGLVACGLAYGRSMKGEDEPLDEADADSYAIWSSLIPVLQPAKKGFVVPALTYNMAMVKGFVPGPPKAPAEGRSDFFAELAWLEVPEPSRAAFAEAAESCKRLRLRRVRVESRLTLPLPYKVLDKAGQQEYARMTPPPCVVDSAHPWHRDRGLERRFAGYSHPCLFSRVFFDESRTLGLVWAGDSLEQWKIHASRKVNGVWILQDWQAVVRTYNC